MSYRLSLTTSPEHALQRAATERLEHAIKALEEAGPDERDAAVHTARKDVKKTRALLRLHRSGLDRDRYRHENEALRGAAGELSELRDARVLLDTVDALADRFAGQRPAAAFDALRETVDGLAPEARETDPAAAVADSRAKLAAIAADIEDWHLRGDGADVIAAGLRRSYSRGRDAAHEAEREPTDEHFHNWRKRVKDLRHQQELLRDAWPGVLSAQADAAKELGDHLGDDHDLAVLTERAAGNPAFEELRELVEARRDELQSAAFRLGRRIYAEPPKRFTGRISGYVQQRRDEEPAELPA
jgi:CHAD domain-containing protein